ncbi:MAG TPA: hypothetical protein VGQ69_00415 [Gemmatimonadales bacterium]|jgi:hypothetical protein|nr:hypothetical protein [Gemmatimonadales bacterium]
MAEREDERIDLAALGGAEPLQADAVIAKAMARIGAISPEREPLVAELAAWWRPGLAAAVILFALGLLLARPRPAQEDTASAEVRVLEWAAAGHVPSNAELLATFQGDSR